MHNTLLDAIQKGRGREGKFDSQHIEPPSPPSPTLISPRSPSEALRLLETVSARGTRESAIFTALFRAPCPQVNFSIGTIFWTAILRRIRISIIFSLLVMLWPPQMWLLGCNCQQSFCSCNMLTFLHDSLSTHTVFYGVGAFCKEKVPCDVQ